MHLMAGGDMPMICASPQTAIDTVQLLEKSAANGKLPISRIDESLARIQAMKRRLRMLQPAPTKYSAADVSSSIAQKAITLIRDPHSRIPLHSRNRILLILPALVNMTMSDTTADSEIKLKQYLELSGASVDTEHIPQDLTREEIARVCNKARLYNTVIQCVYGALQYQSQANLAACLENTAPLVSILIREPYDASVLPKSATVICTYSFIEPSMKALASALFGKSGITGVLPVRLTRKG
jgi:beta-N-acetylhexosaminidase